MLGQPQFIHDLALRRIDLDIMPVLEMQQAVRHEDQELMLGQGVLSPERARVVRHHMDIPGAGQKGLQVASHAGRGIFRRGLGRDAVERGLHGAGRDLKRLRDVTPDAQGDNDGHKEHLHIVPDLARGRFRQGFFADFVDLVVERGQPLLVTRLHRPFKLTPQTADLIQLGRRQQITLVINETGDAFVQQFRVLQVAGGEEKHACGWSECW